MEKINTTAVIEYVKKFGKFNKDVYTLVISKFPNRNLAFKTNGRNLEIVNIFNGKMLYFIEGRGLTEGPSCLELGKNLVISLIREHEEMGCKILDYNRMQEKFKTKNIKELKKI